MRKIMATLVAAGLVCGALALPAAAGKKPKKVHDSMAAQLLPLPKDERWNDAGFTKPGCTSGEEGIHWVATTFKSPGKGSLRFYTEGFTGDHDIYVFFDEDFFLRGDTAQVGSTTPAPPEEEIVFELTKGQEVDLVMCNWAGELDVEAHWEGTFK